MVSCDDDIAGNKIIIIIIILPIWAEDATTIFTGLKVVSVYDNVWSW